MTSGKGSRTASKGCRLRTFRQQVQSRCCSLPREGSVAAAPLAVLPSPIRIASPPLRPSRGSPPPPPPPNTRPCCKISLITRFPGPPAPAGPPIPRRRGRTGPAASFPDTPVAAAPQTGPLSPVPASGPLTCTCLRKWRGPGTAGGQEQQQQQRRGPRHLAHGAAPETGSRVAFRPSVRQSVLSPSAASAAPAPAAPEHTSFRPNLSPDPGPHPPLQPQKHHPSCPPACAAAAAASQQKQRQQLCGATSQCSRAPTAMMGCVM